MRFISENFKFKGMKKESDFTIYPCLKDDTELKLQSDTRMGFVNLNTGKILLSKRCPNGAGFIMASKLMGATELDLTENQLELIKSMRDRMSGNTNPDRTFTIVGQVKEPQPLNIPEDYLKEEN